MNENNKLLQCLNNIELKYQYKFAIKKRFVYISLGMIILFNNFNKISEKTERFVLVD